LIYDNAENEKFNEDIPLFVNMAEKNWEKIGGVL